MARNSIFMAALLATLTLGGAAFLMWLAVSVARAHEAHSQAWTYPPGCCNSAATSPNGDCDVISGRYVKARPDGYDLDLPVGARPKLKTKGYRGFVPNAQVRQSGDFDYHLCISTDGANRYCFFAAPGAM